jgi:hypothetical protein
MVVFFIQTKMVLEPSHRYEHVPKTNPFLEHDIQTHATIFPLLPAWRDVWISQLSDKNTSCFLTVGRLSSLENSQMRKSLGWYPWLFLTSRMRNSRTPTLGYLCGGLKLSFQAIKRGLLCKGKLLNKISLWIDLLPLETCTERYIAFQSPLSSISQKQTVVSISTKSMPEGRVNWMKICRKTLGIFGLIKTSMLAMPCTSTCIMKALFLRNKWLFFIGQLQWLVQVVRVK